MEVFPLTYSGGKYNLYTVYFPFTSYDQLKCLISIFLHECAEFKLDLQLQLQQITTKKTGQLELRHGLLQNQPLTINTHRHSLYLLEDQKSRIIFTINILNPWILNILTDIHRWLQHQAIINSQLQWGRQTGRV